MKIEVNGKSVSLNIDGTYSAEQLLDVLQKIGEARAQVANDPNSPVGLATQCTVGAAWYTEYNTLAEAHTLYFLRPGIGWHGYGLPLAQAAGLASLLGGQVANVLAAAPAITAETGGPVH